MKLLNRYIILFTLLGLTIVSTAQTNRRNTKKSVPHRTNYQRIVSGFNSEFCFEIKQGTLWAWGANSNGQLGDGTTTQRSTPKQIGTDNKWIFIAPGGFHTLGIKSDGTLWAWGNNGNGQVGDGTTTQRNAPKQIGTDTKWVNITCGSFHSHGIKSDGTLWAWGRNDYGQLGDNSVTSRNAPVQIGSDNKWVQISSGFSHTAAIKSDGTIWAWGSNFNGQLGDGSTTEQHAPKQIDTGNKWVYVSAGNTHTLAIKADGTLWAWGYNGNGELGDGTTTNRTSPIQIGTENTWIAASSGGNCSMALKADGTIWNWGENSMGQLGDGTTTNHITPTQMGTDKWVYFSMGSSSGYAVKADGTAWAWGRNNSAQIGNGTTNDQLTPIQIRNDPNEWLSIIGNSDRTSCGLKSDGTIWAWGNNEFGHFGTSTPANSNIPKRIGNDNKWISIANGEYHAIGLKANGTIWTWGNNSTGELGNGTTTTRYTPGQVGTENTWVSIAAGVGISYGLKADGSLWSWGDYLNGKLGYSSPNNVLTPKRIGTDNDWVSISVTSWAVLALKSDGTVWAWGESTYGQVGNGSTTESLQPVKVISDNLSIAISAGKFQSAALKTNGEMWTWGFNGYGGLGDGTTTNKNSPIKVGNITDWAIISSAGQHQLGIKSNGTLWDWGRNGSGQLGNGNNTDVSTPTQVGNAQNWVYISGGIYNSGAITSDRINFCITGDNYHGQIGDGSNTDKNTFTCNTNPNTSQTCPTPTAEDITICSGTSATLTATSANIVKWYASPNGNDSLFQGNTYITNSLFADTTFYAQDSICPAFYRKAVKVKVHPISVTATASATTLCEGESTTLTGQGATTYVWSDGITNNVAFTPTTTKTYTLTGTDANNCSDTATIKIQVYTVMPFTSNASANTICSGGSVILTTEKSLFPIATKFSWSDGVSEGVSFNPTVTKTYTLTGTDPSGCSDYDTITVHVNTSPTVTINANNTSLCAGASTSLSAQGALNYSWSNGISNGVSFTPTSTKTYTVTSTDANNCSDTDTITIIVRPNPIVTANASDITVCNGSYTKIFGQGANTYTWSDGITDNVSFTPTTTKTYTVTGNNQFGCSDTDTITINVSNTANNTTIAVIATANTVCAGESVTLTASTNPPTNNTTYIWTDNVTNGVGFVPSATHTYTVTGRFEDGCSSSTTTVVTVNPLPVITINASDNAVCIGESITLSATTNPTNSQTNFVWSDNVVNGVAFDPVASKSYSVTATNQNNCSSVATVSVTVNPLPVVSAFANSNTVCEGASMFLSGKGAQSYTWSDGINDGVSFIINASQTYTVTGTDANGCVDRDTVFISVKPAPDVSANASDFKICLGDSVYVAATSDNPHYWSDNLTDSTEFAPSTTKTYTVSTTGNNNCIGWDTVTIHVYSFPLGGVVPSATDTLICKGNTITLSGAGADTYRWSGRVKNNVPFTPQRTATYTLTGIVGNTCNNTTFVTVRVLNAPRVTALVYPSNAAVCYGEEVILKGSSPDSVTYTWSHGITDSVAFIPTQDQTYTVTASNGTSCTSQAIKAVRVLPLPVVGINASAASICIGDSVVLKAIGAKTYFWSDNITDSVAFFPTQTATYYVLGKDQFSCSDTAMITIVVDSCKEENPNVGVIETTEKNTITIYPNPNNGYFFIKSAVSGSFTITNELGQTIQVIQLNSSNNFTATINNLNSGIYFVLGVNNDTVIREKIVVTK